MKASTVVFILILIGVCTYFAWKLYQPEASSTYPDIEDFKQSTKFLPQGSGPDNLPQAPGGRESRSSQLAE